MATTAVMNGGRIHDRLRTTRIWFTSERTRLSEELVDLVCGELLSLS